MTAGLSALRTFLYGSHEEGSRGRVDSQSETNAQPEPSREPDTGTGAIAHENEDVPDTDEEWESWVQETDDGFLLFVTRPADQAGKLSRCTVTQEEDGKEKRWSYVLTAKGGINLFGENGFDIEEWDVAFPGDFRGGAGLIPLEKGHRYTYRWIANCGDYFFGNQSWRTVARGEFGR
jgi:hypothetical protein